MATLEAPPLSSAASRGTAPGQARRRGTIDTVVVAVAIAVVALCVVLRFWTTADLWLDEALSVDIARLPLGQLHGALSRDGSPPLYYVLLHFWIRAFGTSDLAVRSLSGVFAVAALPFAWVLGRRVGGRRAAAAVLLLLAASPFAVRYATETRMYALVVLLVAVGACVLARALERPTPVNLVLVALVTACLLYTHYWSLYLVATTAAWLAWRVWKAPAGRRRAALLVLLAVGAGVLAFVPWVPTLVYQSRHTGTPWAAPANFSIVTNTVYNFAGGHTPQADALALAYFGLAALGLFGAAAGLRHVELSLRTRRPGRLPALVAVGTLALGVAGGYVSRSTFEARYASGILLPLMLLVALGIATLDDRRIRLGVLAVAVGLSLVSAVPEISASRTDAGNVAAAVAASGRPGDVLAFCPDQLGPAVYRLVSSGGYRALTFPRGSSPAFVDWVDYAAASAKARPDAFAARLEAMRSPGHRIWFVWAPGYKTLGTKCQDIARALAADRSLTAREEYPHQATGMPSWIAPKRTVLTRYSPATG